MLVLTQRWARSAWSGGLELTRDEVIALWTCNLSISPQYCNAECWEVSVDIAYLKILKTISVLFVDSFVIPPMSLVHIHKLFPLIPHMSHTSSWPLRFFVVTHWIPFVPPAEILIDLMTWSCACPHRCREFKSATAIPCPEDSISHLHSLSPVLASFLCLLLWCYQSLGGVDANVPFRLDHPAMTYPQCFGQLWFSALTIFQGKKKLLWPSYGTTVDGATLDDATVDDGATVNDATVDGATVVDGTTDPCE